MTGISYGTTHDGLFIFHIMLRNAAFFRTWAIPACLVWGVLEFFALQRSRLQGRRGQLVARTDSGKLS